MRTYPLPLVVCLAFLCVKGLHAADTKPMPKEVAALLADYQKELAKAKEPTDTLLRQEASKVAAKLVAEGHAEEAKIIGAQVGDKVAGKPVTDAHSQLVRLFGQYDSAVASVAKPVREKYGHRVDALVRSFAGKDINTVISLGEAKKVIEGVVEPQAAVEAQNQEPKGTMPAKVQSLKADQQPPLNLAGQVWESQWATYSFANAGSGSSLKKSTNATSPFTWKVTGRNVIEYTEKNPEDENAPLVRLWTIDEQGRAGTLIDAEHKKTWHLIRLK